MTWPTVNNVRCEALFASGLQPSEALTASSVEEWISRMAQEFGDHPHQAAERMRWVRRLAVATTARSAREHRPLAA